MSLPYGESDGLPLDSLLGVLLLFQLENMLVEVELQVLVGVVDAQLLETVFLHFFLNLKFEKKGARSTII